ncbi:unnamed protein product, partial [Prorocentrum cordatum]
MAETAASVVDRDEAHVTATQVASPDSSEDVGRAAVFPQSVSWWLQSAVIWGPFKLSRLIILYVGGLLWRLWVGHKRRVVCSDWRELEFAPRELQEDWRALEYASKALRDDREVVQEAVNQSWRALRFASKALRADHEIMLKAVRESNGWALEFASEELYRDPTVVQEATIRLGGRLGVALSPIVPLVPLEPEGSLASEVVAAETDAAALLEQSALAFGAATARAAQDDLELARRFEAQNRLLLGRQPAQEAARVPAAAEPGPAAAPAAAAEEALARGA